MSDNNSDSQKIQPLSVNTGEGHPPLAPSRVAVRVLAGLLARDPDTNIDMQEALRALHEGNRALFDTDSSTNTILKSIAEQMQILEAIFHRYTLEAARPQPADRRAALAKIAFNAQAAYVRAAALLVTAPRRTVDLPRSDA